MKVNFYMFMFIVAVCCSMLLGINLAAMSANAQAATPANVPDVECYPWADAEGWTVTRCEDWANGESCLISSSGMMACRFD